MKHCKTCGTPITNGENGCAMYDECFACRPIVYLPTNRTFSRPRETRDYEGLILARQERLSD